MQSNNVEAAQTTFMRGGKWQIIITWPLSCYKDIIFELRTVSDSTYHILRNLEHNVSGWLLLMPLHYTVMWKGRLVRWEASFLNGCTFLQCHQLCITQWAVILSIRSKGNKDFVAALVWSDCIKWVICGFIGMWYFKQKGHIVTSPKDVSVHNEHF